MSREIDWPTVGPKLLEAAERYDQAVYMFLQMTRMWERFEASGLPAEWHASIAAAKGEDRT